MIGREHELESGIRFLQLLEGRSAALVLEGEAGIGKTTVWRELVTRGAERGYRVLSCRPAAAEAKLSFAGLSDLLADVPPAVLDRLPVPQRHGLEAALLKASPGAGAPQSRTVFAGFLSVLASLATSSPVLVAIDDLQWLDRPTQAAVEFAMRRTGAHRIGFLCSIRTGDPSAASAGIMRALEEAAAERVAIRPLSVAALHHLIVDRVGQSLARPAVVRIATAARGNPFYALEIAREILRRGEPSAGAMVPTPKDVLQLAVARISRLPSATRDALLVAAALSTPRAPLVDLGALQPAEEAGLIEVHGQSIAFSHPLFASAVYGSASAPGRREVHRRLARIIEDPEERARHAALGAAGPSEEIARELDDAAGRAVSRGAPDAAAELLELAAGLTPAAHRDAALTRALAAAERHLHAGDLVHARSLAERVISGSPPPPLRGSALRLLGELRYIEGSFADAIPMFEEALLLVDGDEAAAELHLNLAFAHSILGAPQTAADYARASVESATRSGDPGLQAAALAMSATRDFRLGHPLDRGRLESALALEDPERSMGMAMRPTRLAGIAEYYCDNFARAAELYARLRQRAIERGEDSHLPMVDADLAMVERMRGNLRKALDIADEGCEIARMLDSETARADMLCERSYVRATLGDVAGARADIEQALECATDDGYATSWIGSARAFLELSLGDAAAACDALAPISARVEAAGACDQFTATVIGESIEALGAVGELERAHALTAILERHGQAHNRASILAVAARCRALLAATRGDLESARSDAAFALEQYRQLELPLELGRTLLAAGQIERRAKRKRAARDAFESALETFNAIGARLWADRARLELDRTGVRHSEGDELTPTELRVARLAADGSTNKKIAATLFMSVKTVEANLSRIYLKLGIRSRAELGQVMARRPVANR